MNRQGAIAITDPALVRRYIKRETSTDEHTYLVLTNLVARKGCLVMTIDRALESFSEEELIAMFEIKP